MVRRLKAVVPVVLVAGALTVPSVAGGASTKECTEEGTPHKNFTTSFTQTPACNSNSEVNKSEETATNKGGNPPPGQQP